MSNVELAQAERLYRRGAIEQAAALLHRIEPISVKDQRQRHNLLGVCLSAQGQSAKAEQQFRLALGLAPRWAPAWKNLADLHPFTADDPLLAELQQATEAAVTPAHQAMLHYALGKAWDDIGRHESAFLAWRAGAQKQRSLLRYDLNTDLTFFAQYPQHFGAEWLAKLPEINSPGTVMPVFVMGMPRSGTSLLERILAAHPDIASSGEHPNLQLAAAGRDRPPADGALRPLSPSQLTPDVRTALGKAYRQGLVKRASGQQRLIVDKTPSNFRFIGHIQALLPDARIVLIERDARDIGLSCFRTLFARGQAWSYDLSELGRYLNAFEELMRYWSEHLGDRYIRVSYESLVTEPEQTISTLLDRLGLPVDSACLSPERVPISSRTASKTQVTAPIHSQAIGRWRPYELYLQPMLDQLSNNSSTV